MEINAMSLFSTILEKLGIGTHPQATPDAAAVSPDAANPAASGTAPPNAISEVDVAAKLEALAANHSEKLNWRTSIVDLLKLLEIDSSLTARKALADELHYSGSKDDSAQMNIWLHSAVLKKLAQNGGKVPAEFLD
jgi:hypothetical protein